ncbi:MAG TPA: hypothetical protein DIT98_08065 [Verrucomicrobiales bacterium]|nr:hypothetical protein [Verrucomicrobiales bacterium]HCP37769.1 hypothetical protein [Verrucomicrobiales bacterium]
MIFYDLQYAHGKLFLMRINELKMDPHRFFPICSKTFAVRDSFVSKSINQHSEILHGSVVC